MADDLQQLLPVLAQLSEPGAERATLDDVSAWDGRSAFHVQRSFRRAVGESPLQFQRRVALQRAAALLLSTDRTVLDLALDAGFESHEGFTRAFRAHFGVPPRRFRRLRTGGSHPTEWALRSAPCVGLYRRPLQRSRSTSKPTGEARMSYEMKTQTLEEVPFLFVRRSVEPDKLAEALGEMFGAVYQHALAQGLAFAGPPTARYPRFGPGLITLEAGMPVATAGEGTDEIEAGVLVGGPVVTTIHKGPYDNLGDGHQAIERWLEAEGRTSAGAPWEAYVTDPGEVPDPAEWLTEITWPLEA